jgi:hypothetical protein
MAVADMIAAGSWNEASVAARTAEIGEFIRIEWAD